MKRWLVPAVLAGAVLSLLALGAVLALRAADRTNKIALASSPKGVTVVEAHEAHYRPSRRYVGTIEPWVSARVGPQWVSAYVDTVLFRPGAVVKRGDVLATLDCRNVSASAQAVSMQARALDAKQQAFAHEAARVSGLLDGGFVSPNEAEQKEAESASRQAELLAARAKLASTSLEVGDCVLRAPFDGEVAERSMDPGAFVRPGTSIVTVVDRSTVRVTADVPEVDFAVVAPGTLVKLRALATAAQLTGAIARRAPAADPGTRTVRFEVDIPDPARQIPVGTTAEIGIDVGEPIPAVSVPLTAASVRDKKATLFAIENGSARKVTADVLGESEGNLFLAPSLHPGTHVVTQGRGALNDGDGVAVNVASQAGTSGATKPARAIEPSSGRAAEPER